MGTDSFSQKAYLSIYISYNTVCANLAYADKSTDRVYILKDKSFLLENFLSFAESEIRDYWLSYFRSLEKKWNWDFLQTPKVSQSGLAINFKRLISEGEGISGIKVSVLKSNPNHREIFESLRKFSVEIKILSVASDSIQSLLESFATSVNYEDVLLLDLNARFFRISRVEKEKGESKANLSKMNRAEYTFNTEKSEWGGLLNLLELFSGKKYKSFLSQHVPSNFMSNISGNFLLNPAFKSNVELLQDFIRSYITIQLLSLCSENTRVYRDFGVKPGKNLLWVTGDLIEIPEFKKLLIAIIDGLQLKGAFDFVLDGDSRIYTFGKTFSLGEKTDEIELNREVFLPGFVRVFAPDIDLRADSRKVVFDGTLSRANRQSVEIFGMSSEITEINVKDPKTTYLEGKFVKNAYLEKYRKLFEFRCLNDGISWEKIVLDCRIKPVVYGPNAKANNIKFNMWLSGESYT